MAMIACIKATAGEATQGLETDQVPFQSLGYEQDLERVLLGLSGEIGVEDLSETLAPIESFYPDLSAGVNSGEGIESEPPLYIGTRIMYWYHPDYVSNVDMVTDKSGEAYELFLYNAWGESLHHWSSSSTNSWSSPYRFNSKELDSETGMHYGARYHYPKLSVWMSVDPLAHQTLEAYQFTGNNPIALIDPDGEDIVVLINHDGAHGFGHMGILIGNDNDGWVYLSKDGRAIEDPSTGNQFGTILTGGKSVVARLEFEKGQGLNEVLESLGSSDGYDEALQFNTDVETDETATKAFTESARSEYHVLFANCGDAVEDALESVGINTGNDENGPSPVTPDGKFLEISMNNFDFLLKDNPIPIVIQPHEENLAQ